MVCMVWYGMIDYEVFLVTLLTWVRAGIHTYILALSIAK